MALFQYTGKVPTIYAMRPKRRTSCRTVAKTGWLSLWPAAARAALPGVPITKQFELLVEAGFLHENVEFGARKAFAKRCGTVGDSPSRQRSEHGVQLQLAHIDFVQ